MCKVMVVMFWPKTISSADGAFSKSAIAVCSSATMRSTSPEVTKGPCILALVSSRQRLIASATDCGTCVPPGLSK